MRIQQVEQEVGISKTNIRFYEAEGLISPRREGANGYRDYSQEDVAALRRIKLLRKLDVPLPEVKAMLAGQITLAEGMRRHQLLLEHRQADLDAARELCESLAQRPGPLGALDAEAFLETMTRQEEKGVTFVDVRQNDRRDQYLGALLGGGSFVLLMLMTVGLILWGMSVEPIPWPAAALLLAIPLLCIFGTVVVFVQRVFEIKKGEFDAYRQY